MSGGKAFSRYREFLKIFSPIAAVLVIIFIVASLVQQSIHRNKIFSKEKSAVSVEKQVIETEMDSHLSDAIVLARITSFMLSRKIPQTLAYEYLTQQLKFFTEVRGIYDQIRFLDTSGREAVRINLTPEGSGEIVPPEGLQDKSSRRYFKKGIITRGEVYVSKFDLNIEHGEIERPFKPMVRYATPVLGSSGETMGLIVLNYMGDNLIDRLNMTARGSDGRVRLLNNDGYWLLGPSPKDEWGFMFEDKKSRSMAALYPDEWGRIAAAEKGQFIGARGLITFETVYPVSDLKRGITRPFRGESEEYWKIVSVVDPQKLVDPDLIWLLFSAAVLLALSAFMVWMWAGARVQRLEARESLRQSEETLRQVSDSVQDAIIMADSTGKTIFWSKAAVTMFGYEEEEALGKNVHHLIAPEEIRAKAIEGYEHFRKTGEGLCVGNINEFTAIKKDQTTFPAELSVAAARFGDEWYAAGTVRDITERKKGEEALKEAKLQAEAASRAKSQFLANMSHELRTPMNAIIGFSEILEDRTFGELNEKQARYINHIVTSGRHLLALINDILDLSKVEAGKMELEPGDVDIPALLEKSVVLIREKALKHNIKLDLKLSGEIEGLVIRADERKLLQVLYNLLSNAAKFTPDKGAIEVAAWKEDGRLHVSVTDTGIGIKRDDLERIFGEFEQVDPSLAKHHEGTGLGLALTRKLLELHDGKIWAESEGEGKGSRFVFTIPIY